MLNVSKLLTVATVCIALGSIAVAAGNGSTPNGKPFVKINDELVEVSGAITSIQDQIDMLVARVDTVEDRVGALETAVSDIEANNVVLEAMISQNTTDIASITQAVTDLESENAVLQSQIDDNSGDIQTAQTQLSANEALIVSLQGAIISLESGSIAADADLQGQIDNNLALISAMQGEIDAINQSLALKQNIIDQTCPTGEVMIGVTENSISCAPEGSGTAAISTYTVTAVASVPPNYSGQRDSTCNAGDILTGGGFITYGKFRILTSYPFLNRWVASGVNYNSYTANLYSYAKCLRTN